MWCILPSLQNFIQCRDFSPMSRYFSSVATLCRESHQVWRILTSIETFIQCGDFYPVLRYLLSIGTFVKYWDFYQA